MHKARTLCISCLGIHEHSLHLANWLKFNDAKKWDFEAEKIKINVKKSNIQLCFYVLWPFTSSKTEKKSTIAAQNKQKSKRDQYRTLLTCSDFWDVIVGFDWQKMAIRHKIKVEYLIVLHLFWFFSASKSHSFAMRPPLTSITSKTVLPNI